MKLTRPSSLFKFALASTIILSSTAVLASAFQIWEQGSGIGDYHAGAAAEGNDASSEFYNPALTTRLNKTEISVGGVYIPVHANFKGYVTSLGLENETGYYGVNSDTVAVVPNFHIVVPITEKLRFNFGETTPFGLTTRYPANFDNVASQAATKTSLKTINLNPGLSYAITKRFSIGAGFDALWGTAVYDNNANIVGSGAYFKNELSGWGYGYNVGLLYELSDATRFGLSYRSQVNINADGPSSFDTSVTSTVSAAFPLPATIIGSIYHDYSGQRWSSMASVMFTEWHEFATLILKNTAFGQDINVHEDYRNTFNVVLGAHYKICDKWMLKFGTGFEQTPTQTGYRDIRLPDTWRIPFSVGANWKMNKSIRVDMGFTHLFTPHANINNKMSSEESGDIVPAQQGKAVMNANVIGAEVSISL